MERTYRFKQADIAKSVHVGVSRKAVDLTLDTYGPYKLSYSRNGRYMLLGGAKGHVAVVDWNSFSVSAEFHVRESIHDVAFLHNSMLFAVAQSKYAYIYDHTGMEVHVLRSHIQPLALDFLPYHFLLASTGNAGFLKYQDVSTGALVAEHRTKLGACSVMRHNPWNGVECLGHSNGCVTMWTPNLSTPVVRMLTHRGPVTALAIDSGGRYCVTAGADARMKVWDIRKFSDEPVFNYFLPSPAHTLDVSQRGLVAVGYASHVQVWGRDFALENDAVPVTMSGSVRSAQRPRKGPDATSSSSSQRREGGGGDDDIAEGDDGAAGPSSRAGSGSRLVKFDDDDEASGTDAAAAASDRPSSSSRAGVAAGGINFSGFNRKAAAPYLRHELPGKTVVSVRFRPFDDVLAVGHSGGLSSLLVPGAGEPNYDSREADPFQTNKGRREAEVRGLLDKLPAASITLDPGSVAGVDKVAPAVRERERAADAKAAAAAGAKPRKERTGKSSSERRRMKKNANVVTEARAAMVEKNREKKNAEREAAALSGGGDEDGGQQAGAGGGRASGGSSALSRFYKSSAK